MLKQLKQRNEGFTIIEVLIVLAIAGLILVIVFLAIPNLQRNQRNTGRKNDASRLATALANYASNNNGTLPTSTNWTSTGGSCASILSDSGKFDQANWTSGSCATSEGANNLDFVSGAYTPSTTVTSGFEAIVDVNSQCSTSTPGTTQAAGNTRKSAVLYDLETSSGNYSWTCLNAT